MPQQYGAIIIYLWCGCWCSPDLFLKRKTWLYNFCYLLSHLQRDINKISLSLRSRLLLMFIFVTKSFLLEQWLCYSSSGRQKNRACFHKKDPYKKLTGLTSLFFILIYCLEKFNCSRNLMWHFALILAIAFGSIERVSVDQLSLVFQLNNKWLLLIWRSSFNEVIETHTCKGFLSGWPARPTS